MAGAVSRRIIRRFMKVDPTLATIYEMTSKELTLQFSIPQKNASKLYSTLRDSELKNQLIETVNKYTVITFLDKTYPSILRSIKDAPLVLFCMGNIALLKHPKMLSVIGSRKPSKEAKPKLEYILTPLLQEGWLIVSGMARGIDGLAHTATLVNGGKTIAVLGGGFEHIYPKEHLTLFNEIIKNGLVISEYPPFKRSEKYHFPERNRIISGLSFGTLVIEAMERSGTMITVEQALDQGREVFAVPGSPLLPQTKGCHLLIQDGAKLTQHANDIQEEWLLQTASKIPKTTNKIAPFSSK